MLIGLIAGVLALVVLAQFVNVLRKERGLTEPLGNVAGLYGRFLILYLLFVAWRVKDGLYGGPNGSACVDTGLPVRGRGAGAGIVARPGASLSGTGDVQVCALHPSAGQLALYLLTSLPGLLLWACVLLAIWRLLRQATLHGPFTPQAAATIRQLGWIVIAGSMAVAALGALGSELLSNMLMTTQTFGTSGTVVEVLIFAPLKALFPVPALAGATLISFGRITRVGAVMDEELKATV
jgi:hypothetical protein